MKAGKRGRGGHFRSFFGFGEGHGRGGNPWGGRRFFEAGEVRIALLALLEDGPKHGYELMKELEARSGGTYKASAGTVYPNLQMLEDEGLIRAETRDDGKRVFVITAEGRAELERNQGTADRIWDRASDWDGWADAASPGGLEIMGPLIRLAQAAFKTAGKADEARIERVRSILTKAREELEKA